MVGWLKVDWLVEGWMGGGGQEVDSGWVVVNEWGIGDGEWMMDGGWMGDG